MSSIVIDAPIQSLPWSHASSHEVRNPFKKDYYFSYRHSFSGKVKNRKKSSRKLIGSLFSLSASKETSERKVKAVKSEISAFECSLLPKDESQVDKSITEQKVVSSSEEFTPYISECTSELFYEFSLVSQAKLPTEEEIEERSISLTRNEAETAKIMLFLDLDETLVHVLNDNPDALPSLTEETAKRVRKLQVLENGELIEYKYLFRPKLHRFLALMSVKYDISVSF